MLSGHMPSRAGPAANWSPTASPLALAFASLQRLKGEVDLENYENVPVPKPKQLPDDDDD